MKNNSHNVGETPEKQSFKKSYLKRITGDKEADSEIERCINYEQQDYYGEWHDRRDDTAPGSSGFPT